VVELQIVSVMRRGNGAAAERGDDGISGIFRGDPATARRAEGRRNADTICGFDH